MSKSKTINVPLKTALSDRYLAYALSTIKSRSLPDVRDGLKPVHRRLLYAMLRLKLDPEYGFKKCARVVGDVIGKYHPHGDVAVYDTMVRLAQEFALRYPLVEGQGNFGSIDGDNAAAMRYTEAKLTDVAMLLLRDLDKDTVDFVDTYDSSDREPVVFPAYFPNLLANGSEGIAVGMATSIPPHNIIELCNGLLHLISNPEASTADLVKHVKAPDFPTGGIIREDKKEILRAYETGRGSIRLRAKWKMEELPRGIYQIAITEIPYQVQKSRLIEKIADLFKNKKLPLLANIRDESADDIRVIIEPKSKNIKPETLMESLFRVTDLEIKFNMNMNVINSKNVPKLLGLKDIMTEFLSHQMEVIIRKSKFRLDKISARLEILDGFLIAFLNLDEVIRIIREEEDPKKELSVKFKLTENQVESILNMRLRSLRKLEEMAIKTEYKSLSEEQKKLRNLLASENARHQEISLAISQMRDKFSEDKKSSKRRSAIIKESLAEVIPIDVFIEKEPITILCSKKGWIRAFKNHYDELPDARYKEGDALGFLIKAHTTDKLLIFSNDGKFFTLGCDKISGGRGDGDPLRVIFDINPNAELLDVMLFDSSQKFLVTSDIGKGFIISGENLISSTRNGRQIINLSNGATAFRCQMIDGDMLATLGENKKMLIFPISDIPEMRKGQGVTLQKYKDGKLADIKIFNSKHGLEFGGKRKKRLSISELNIWIGKRSATGRMAPETLPKNCFDSNNLRLK